MHKPKASVNVRMLMWYARERIPGPCSGVSAGGAASRGNYAGLEGHP